MVDRALCAGGIASCHGPNRRAPAARVCAPVRLRDIARSPRRVALIPAEIALD
jgi:hypothetical protein